MPLPPGALASVPVPRPPPPVDEEPLILERPLKEPAPVAPTVGPTKRQRQLSAAAAFAEGQRVGREEAERPAQQRVAVVPRQSPYARRMGAPRSEEMVALQARKAAAEKAEDKKALEELTTQILKLSAAETAAAARLSAAAVLASAREAAGFGSSPALAAALHSSPQSGDDESGGAAAAAGGDDDGDAAQKPKRKAVSPSHRCGESINLVALTAACLGCAGRGRGRRRGRGGGGRAARRQAAEGIALCSGAVKCTACCVRVCVYSASVQPLHHVRELRDIICIRLDDTQQVIRAHSNDRAELFEGSRVGLAMAEFVDGRAQALDTVL